MKNHAPPPQLCAHCLAIVHALADAGPLEDPVLKFCPHAAVIAVASRRAGAIHNWHLERPLTEAEAIEIAAKLHARFAAAGMKVHDVTRQ
jgi:hypothetical protein